MNSPLSSGSPTPENDALRVSLIIPALNEEESLPPVVDEALKQECVGEVIVVDDGSNDATADRVLAASRRDARVKLCSHPVRRGNGAAVKTGLMQDSSCAWAAVLDADGQHPPALLTEMVKKLRDEHLDMVVAARDFRTAGGGTPRTLSNRFLSWCGSLMLGAPVPDITSGYRVADRAILKRFHRLYPEGFSFPLTSTVAFLLAGYRVGFVMYPGAKRSGGASKISFLKDGQRFFIMLLRLSLWCPLRTFLLPAVAFLTLGFAMTLRTVILSQAVGTGGVLFMMLGLACLFGALILQQLVNLRLDIMSWLDTAAKTRRA